MLHIRFDYDDDLTYDTPVLARERRGQIKYGLYRGLFLPQGVAALNATVQQVLNGGQWFQIWQGEIISLNTPPTPRRTDARLHRGPLAHQTARPQDW